MADARPRTDGAAAPTDATTTFEVPLTGPGLDPGTERASPGGDGPPPGRSLPALAVGIGVVAATIGVGALVLSIGGDDGDDDSTATAPAAPGADITTPPTLRPLETLPAPDDPQLRRTVPSSPEATSSQDRSLFDGVVLPEYPTVSDVGLAELVQYDFAGAVAMLADDVPRRSTTHLELGTAGFVLDVTIERDPERDRYRVTFDTGDDLQTAVVDVATGVTYVRAPDGSAIEVLNAEIIANSDAADVNEFFDRLLLGPVRPDTFVAAATRGRGLVTVDDVRIARRFIANIQGAAAPEWQLYVFSPVFEFPVEDRPSLLEYSVYVDDDGRIVQVDGLSMVGDVPQLVLHRMERLDEPVVIELPPPVTVPGRSTVPTTRADDDEPVEGVATTAPGTAPSTTPGTTPGTTP